MRRGGLGDQRRTTLAHPGRRGHRRGGAADVVPIDHHRRGNLVAAAGDQPTNTAAAFSAAIAQRAAVVLVRCEELTSATDTALHTIAPDGITVIGSADAVSRNLEAELADHL